MAPLPTNTTSTSSPLSRILLNLPKKPNSTRPSLPPRDAVAADATKKNPGALVLRRRDAVAAAVLSVAMLSRMPQAAVAETGVDGVCHLEMVPSGLAFCERVIGSGEEAQKGQLVKVHYTGMLEDGTVFDSTYKRKKPLVFRVGAGEVIQGWDQGIGGGEGVPAMRAGGRRTLRVPPMLAYGEKGAGCKSWEPTSCVIPPDSTLLFEVEFMGKASG